MSKSKNAAPDLNAYAERWVQTAKQECLDHFVVFGQRLSAEGWGDRRALELIGEIVYQSAPPAPLR
jgi:hypothetical protein